MTIQNTMTLADALDFAQRCRDKIQTYAEYDEAHVEGVRIEPDRLIILLDLRDDFQNDVGYEHREQHGVQWFTYFFNFEDARICDDDFALEQGPMIPPGVLTREQRELRVMCSQTGEIKAYQKDLKSAAGRAHVARIVAERDAMAKLLVDMR